MAKVLVVEDEVIVAWNIAEALEEYGHFIVAKVGNGIQAVQLAREKQPDVIIMDIQLKGKIDGITAAEQIYHQWHIPVIYLTAHADEQTLQRALKTSPFGYLIKPFNSGELHTTIETTLQRKQAEILLDNTLTSREDGTIITDTNDYIKQAEFLRSIYEGTQLSIFVVDVLEDGNFRFVGMNPAYELLTGLRSADIWGKTPEEILPPEAATTVRNRYLECVNLGKAISYEECLPFQGTDSWWITNLTPMRDEESRIYRLVGTSVNITERKKVEEALQISQARFAGILELANEAIISIDTNQSITLFNQGAEKIFGYKAEEILGQPLSLLLPKKTAETHSQHLKNFAISPNKSRRMGESRGIFGRRKDGSEFPVEASISKLEIEGKVIFTSILRDISERKQAEAELLRREQEFRALVENAPDMIIRVDRQYRYLYVNPVTEKLTGIPTAEFIGKNSAEIGMPEYLVNLWHTAMERAFQTKQEQTLEYQSKVITGLRTYYSRIVPELAADTSVESVLVIVRDITELKQAEEQQRKQAEREHLMRLITQRIHQSLDLQKILNTTVTEVRQTLQTDRVIIYRFDPDWSGIVIVESVDDAWQSLLGKKITDPCIKAEQFITSYVNGRYQAVTDIYTSGIALCYRDLLAKLQVRANLVVPIVQGNHLWGFLVAQHCSQPRHWQHLEIDLLQQISAQVAIAIQQSELYQKLQIANQELHRIARVDALTQLANRRCFDEYLQREWLRLAREKSPLSLILCDVDYFKRYNDTYGHLAGDECLTQVAQGIQSVVKRPADLVARYGGEEFAIILPHTDTDGALKIVSQIRQQIELLTIPHAASFVANYITVSLGIASTVPLPRSSPQTLIDWADRALYQAKGKGRNCYHIYSENYR